MIMIMFLVMIMSSLRYQFPLDHKNLMFMVMLMTMLMIVMPLVGTKPNCSSMYRRSVPAKTSGVVNAGHSEERLKCCLALHREQKQCVRADLPINAFNNYENLLPCSMSSWLPLDDGFS